MKMNAVSGARTGGIGIHVEVKKAFRAKTLLAKTLLAFRCGLLDPFGEH
jgi:hypothetical protein